ncbi:hypothetical protein COU57_05400 [Candidatus Pacearchaeota archaeon CG10_big_fil_rev_8_21_14_0_10_32_14]|nr:MAG: hypothetical protein COU57_05400 [Candidatus Pacearchaeota archaeon CG10_big_fil_rev_8_21_14_0_10_32_14]
MVDFDYTVSYILREESVGEAMPRRKFNEHVEDTLRKARLLDEKKGTDFGDYKKYLLQEGVRAFHETDEHNPRLTIYRSKKSAETYTPERRLRFINTDTFHRIENFLKRMYGTFENVPLSDFGPYLRWDNIGHASRCIIEHNINRLTIYGRDEEDALHIERKLNIWS